MIGPKKSRKLIGPEMGIRFFGYFGGSGHIDRPTRKTLKTDRPRNGDKGFAMKYSMKLEPGFNNKLISVEILIINLLVSYRLRNNGGGLLNAPKPLKFSLASSRPSKSVTEQGGFTRNSTDSQQSRIILYN